MKGYGSGVGRSTRQQIRLPCAFTDDLCRTCAAGPIAGIFVSFGYVLGTGAYAGLVDEPLGALVKTGPAIVPMLVAL
jgi:hypothetical protein